LAVVLLKN